jgi:hypothetical protein
MLPNTPTAGGDTGEFRYRESKTFGVEYASIRAATSMSTSYRMRLPPSIGVVDYCVKRGATVVDGDGVNSIPLRFDVCAAPGGTEWISATHDSANQHLSTVYTNNVVDYADWVVRRSRGTEATPTDTVVGDFIAGTNYQARVGGTFKPQLIITSKRITATPTAVADWRLTMYDAAGAAHDKLLINDKATLDSDFLPAQDVTHSLGSTALRWKKLWVQDIDCTGACGIGSNWFRNTTAGYVRPLVATDDVRTRAKYVFEDAASVTTADIEVSSGPNESMQFRDKAGNEMLKLQVLFATVSSKEATLDATFIPKTGNLFNLGIDSTRMWNGLYVQSVYPVNLRPSATAASGAIKSFAHLNPAAADSYDLGTATDRWRTLFVKDIDCIGVCPGGSGGWTRITTPTTLLTPTVVADDVRITNKLLFQDRAGAGVLSALTFDIYADVGGAGARYMVFRDNGGGEMLRLERMELTSVTDKAIFDLHLIPKAAGARDLGLPYTGVPATDRYWRTAYINGVFLGAMASLTGNGQILSYSHFMPDATASDRDLGATTVRWRTAYVQNINASLTCTVAGSSCNSLLTDAGATTYLTATTDNFCIGCATTTNKLEVAGNFRTTDGIELGNNLKWTSDAGGDIGLPTGNRPGSIYAVSAYYVYSGAGPSAFVRTSLSGGGLILRSSVESFPGSGIAATTFSISANTGSVITSSGSADFGGGYKVGANVGISGTFSVSFIGCTLTLVGGLVTGRSC